MEGMREVTVQTDLHRAMGSSGIVARIDASGKVVAWKLADGGSWTTADLRAAQVTVDIGMEGR